jgi:acetyl/propionyl-CoA carboxylase alpha subunit
MAEALAAFKVKGLKTNIPFLRLMLEYPPYVAGELHTGLAEELIRSKGYKDRLESLKLRGSTSTPTPPPRTGPFLLAIW